MYHEYTQEELRAYCRTCIETFEIWARRFIHEAMSEKYGNDYLYAQLPTGDYIVGKEVRKQVERMMQKEPDRFSRKIDTLFVENIADVLCNDKLYRELFGNVLLKKYPEGKEEVRTFLTRIAGIRNYLSHANPISVRQAEQAICYSHDFIDCIKEHYKAKGEEQVWNVPRIIKITDSFGNVFDNPQDRRYGGSNFFVSQPLNCGDTYSIEVEVDSSFSPSEYDLNWRINHQHTKNFDNQDKVSITLTEKDVNASFSVECMVISNKAWHKYGTHDGVINIVVQVFPPLE